MQIFTQFYAPNRKAWRKWLAENHQTEKGVWLIYYKVHTNQPTVPYNEAVEEALCFGWIDSKPNKLDDDRYMQMFTPRKPKSVWSRLNKIRVAALIKEDKMMDKGLKAIEVAKKNGHWTIYDEIENLVIPEDLSNALSENLVAQQFFEKFSDSSKKNILWWIKSAKQAATRQRRIEKTVALAAVNKKANH
ncbi:MAG: YdeI/OmpD-associated family protein [Chitinophagales bacterium]